MCVCVCQCVCVYFYISIYVGQSILEDLSIGLSDQLLGGMILQVDSVATDSVVSTVAGAPLETLPLAQAVPRRRFHDNLRVLSRHPGPKSEAPHLKSQHQTVGKMSKII